jgi:uncharacterized protein YaaQ
MLLLVVVVQSEDGSRLSDRLLAEGIRLTRLNGTGGFLATGSAVLLIGVEEARLPAVTAIIEATCHTRTRMLNAAPYPGMAGVYAMGTVSPVEVLIGGAVVISLPVERFLRLGGSPSSPGVDQVGGDAAPAVYAEALPPADATERMANVTPNADPAADKTAPAQATKFVVAIVQKESVDVVVNALMDGGHRLTRIDTAGGFLRRGNATLLIGVEAARLNDVLTLIQTNCRPRSAPTPIEEGMPMFGATVFVLDTSHFLRF